jgi:probable F420-dependent oxidoreductase
MKVGVAAFLTEHSGNPGAIAAAAERAGFESFWVAEHLVIPASYTTYYPRSADGKVPEFYAHLVDPFVALAAAAQTTSRIRLGTSICLLPERNPIETAKAVATLDMYSGGRVTLGVGAGWFPEEAAVMGVDFRRRWRHLRQSVEAMRELWSDKPEASYEGDIIRFPAVKLYPKPVQKPFPPILLGAHDPGPALKRVARWADGWMPGGLSPEKAAECIPQVKRMARENGRDPERLEFSVLLGVPGQQTPPSAFKRYAAAGVTRLIILAAEMATRDGLAVVKELAPVVERAAQA